MSPKGILFFFQKYMDRLKKLKEIDYKKFNLQGN